MASLLKASPEGDTLIYFGDPMCSWCYGFTPELEKIKAAYPNANFQMVMGGLRAHGEESMEELSKMLWQHWQDVQKASGQRFNFGILQKSDFYYDTEPACRAVTLVRMLYPEMEHTFFKALQHTFYFENNDPTIIDTYVDVLERLKLNPKEFVKLFKTDETKDAVEYDFQTAQAFKVQSFPTLIAKIDGKYFMVSNGYQKAEKLINLLREKGLK